MSRVRPMLRLFGTVVLLAFVGVLAIFLLLALVGGDPLHATWELLIGPVTSPLRTSEWVQDSTNLMLTGLAVSLVFRAGQFAIGAEGQVALGALAAGAVVLSVGGWSGLWIVGLLAACAAGFLWGAVPGWLKTYFGADEIVSTLMLNYVALNLFSLVIKLWLEPPYAGYVVSNFFPTSANAPSIVSKYGIGIGLPIALVACVAAHLFFARTRTGYEMRMIGLNARFARNVGLRVSRSTWLVMALSGIPAGLAGALVAESQTHRLILGLSANLGYNGILVALIAANRPLLVPPAAIAYGYLVASGDIAQITTNIPTELVTTVQGVLILIITARLRGVPLRRLGQVVRDRLESRKGAADVPA